MKMSNLHEVFNGLCYGCNAAVKQEDVDPDSLYNTWLCGRCRAELEQLPPRHKIVFDRLRREMESVAGKVRFLDGKIAVLEGFIISHGLNPQAADDSYADAQKDRKGIVSSGATTAGRNVPLLAQLTTLCREISDWLWYGPMTDLDKRIKFADRLEATLKQAGAQRDRKGEAR